MVLDGHLLVLASVFVGNIAVLLGQRGHRVFCFFWLECLLRRNFESICPAKNLFCSHV